LVYKKEIPLGADLKGGTRLAYMVPIAEAKAAGLVGANESSADIVKKTIDVMNKRVDGMGLREIAVTPQGDDEIVVELPGLTEIEVSRIKDTITSLGRLEFRILVSESDPIDVERERRKLNDWLDKPEQKAKIELWEKQETQKKPTEARDLLFWVDLLRGYNFQKGAEGPVKGLRWYPSSDRKDANWSGEMRKTRPGFAAIRIDEELNPKDSRFVFRGEDLSDVGITRGGKSGGIVVNFKFRSDRKNDFGDFTEANMNRPLAIILNGVLDTSPNINSRIDGDGIIESSQLGGYQIEDAKQLVTVLETGSLQVKPRLIEEARMGAGLGEDSIKLGVWSSSLGLAATVLFMLLYYRLAGGIAAISLGVNGAILLGVLAVYNATLTLPGIGGFILTLAMAVDSNILIYERIREERDRGRGIDQAVRLGFERAFVTIVDSNLTTLITSVILLAIGTGPIKGLGLTLSVGILTTLFTALVFTKACFAWLLSKKRLPDVKMLRLFKTTPNLRFIKIWKFTVFVSVTTSILGLVAFFAAPESVFGIDFVGGATARLRLREPIPLEQFRKLLEIPGFESVDATYSLSAGSIVPGKPGYKEYVVKAKLSRERREQMKHDASEKGQSIIANFREGLRKALGDRLLPDPISDVKVVPGADNATKATFVLNFEDPIAGSRVQELLHDNANYLTAPTVEGAAATQTSFPVTAGLPAGITAEELTQRIPASLAVARATAPLSDPFPEVNTIQPRAAKSLKNKAILSLLIAFLGIVLYVRFRFHEYRYGIGGVIGIVHDLVVTLGAVAIANYFGWVDVEIDMTLIAVFLTIAGYSINDTIVIYDRIRENLAKPEEEKKPLDIIVDESCNQTLSRTLLTSTAAFMASALMFIVNRGKHNPLEGFGFTMMVGIVSGTYSSIWVASLFVVAVEKWNQRKAKKTGPRGGAPAATPAPAAVSS
jgi:SecD/SecF fusion protein